MANTFRGKAQVVGTAFTADVVLYPIANSLKQNHEFQEDIVPDTQGNDYAWRAYNEKYMGDVGLTLVDQSSSSTAAHAKAGGAFFAPYAILTISGCDLASWNTTWQIVSGADINQEATAVSKMNLKLRRYADSTQNTLAATIPS